MYLFIHRRDLRTEDLPGFEYLRKLGKPGIHLFVLDMHLLGSGRHGEPSGRAFLQRLEALEQQYTYYGRKLHVLQGDVTEIVSRIMSVHQPQALVYHSDATPYAKQRDARLAQLADARGVRTVSFFDLPLVDPFEFQKFSGKSDGYKVFTPFYRKWAEYLESRQPHSLPTSIHDLHTVELDQMIQTDYAVDPGVYPVSESQRLPIAADVPRKKLATFFETQIEHYKQSRDDYHYDSTSRLSLFLNTGAISAREVYESALHQGITGATDPWLRQLAWRDFYLYQSVTNPNYYDYEKQYDFSALDDRFFARWATGQTGVPIVDAAMRELNETGHMHNRLRMVTAMFLTKNLLCPFMLGEAHFRKKLLDYDNALNRGGWLWSSSLGYDGAPYFRIMNPVMQSERFDPEGIYLRKWLPELATFDSKRIHLEQPGVIVDVKASRQQAIDVYKVILEKAKSK